MSIQDEFAAFIRGLQPRLKAPVGALVEENLAEAMRLAARYELWTSETSGSGSGGSTSRREKQGRGKGAGTQSGGSGPKNQGKVHVAESSVATVQGGKKKGQGQPPQRQQGRGRGRGQGGPPPCFLCQSREHLVHDCPDWQTAREALKKAKKQGN